MNKSGLTPPDNFSITIFDEIKPVSTTISKSRARVFYQGRNRNGSYINEEFAQKLLSTVAYSPVKGIYDAELKDFTDHGSSRSMGKPYGFVPYPSNFKWEKHLDEDGIEREYACVDVYLWTALYPEANYIVGKPQSMELFRPSIRGDWKDVGGERLYVYEDAAFLGLQVLGDTYTPAFEGAGFFEIQSFYKEHLDNLQVYFSLIEGGSMEIKNTPQEQEVKDEFVEEKVVEEEEIEEVEEEEIEEEEEENVEPEAEEESFSLEEKTNLEAKIVDLENQITTLYQEQSEKDLRIANLEEELSSFKEAKELADQEKKETIISKFEKLLDKETLDKFREGIDSYEIEGLERELSHEYVKKTPSLFGQEQRDYVPKDQPPSGLEAALLAQKERRIKKY